MQLKYVSILVILMHLCVVDALAVAYQPVAQRSSHAASFKASISHASPNEPRIIRMQLSDRSAKVSARAQQGAAVIDMPLTGGEERPAVDAPPTTERCTEYQRGLAMIGFITLLFSSNSPAIHGAFTAGVNPPPVLVLNAMVSCIGLAALPACSMLLPDPKKTVDGKPAAAAQAIDGVAVRAGIELGLWKFLGTTANLYGLSLTSAGHGAFLIQLTTLIVPAAQGAAGVPIPTRIWTAIGLALAGMALFTQDPDATGVSAQGDLFCVFTAVLYSVYDLRLFHWGKRVGPLQLITAKVGVQAALSVGLAVALTSSDEFNAFLNGINGDNVGLLLLVALWCGVAVNALAPLLQVEGQQLVGPARAQVRDFALIIRANIYKYRFFFASLVFGI
uniref:EamA domain-containing protein n=1 Tax=Chrysotila carterae TaxID=13221 RepID=A0A7S4B2M3_CHRCT